MSNQSSIIPSYKSYLPYPESMVVNKHNNNNNQGGLTRSNTINLNCSAEEVEKLESALHMVMGHLKILNMEASSGMSVF